MKNFYTSFQIVVCICVIAPGTTKAQCALLDAACVTYESRCAATGAIKVFASGGSGNYKYKTTGPVNTNFTTSDSITGLSAGIYTVIVNDVVTNCTFTQTNVVVAGTYQDPRFSLVKTDVSCDNASNGSITVDSYSFGRAPFVFSIVAPSPMGVGTSNSTGFFPGLMAGDYSIRMTDSCGGIQTRQITVINYTWWIDAYAFTKTGCDEASGFIKVVDSRGNISTVGGIPGFSYGVVRTAGDTIWSADPYFNFLLLGHNNFDIVAKDNCGIIKKASTAVSLVPTVAANVTTYNYQCNFFSASLSVGTNFLNPDFCLYDSANVLVNCNTTGVFTGIAYGSYCIRAHDNCTDTVVSKCFRIAAPPVSIDNNVLITDKTCNSFTASITGQTGLTSPEYCLYDSSSILISCNNTGVFTGLEYQPYCITTTDGCRDTTIIRCFNPSAPTPVIPDVILPMYITCTNFGIHVGGDSLTLPEYCLYDSSGVLMVCNNTGVFDSIPLGHYCIAIHDACTDTTITRCLDILKPVINNDMITSIRDKTCAGFTLTVSSHNLGAVAYCLYNSSDVLISCNASGVFANIPYGSYCIKAHAACPDTVLVSCITEYPDLPSVSASVGTGDLTCSTFSAYTMREHNLTHPTYCIYDDRGVLVDCNTRGLFESLVYGSYCIKITDGCYDTTITRCFSQASPRISLTGNAGKSCSYGWAQFSLNMGGGSGYFPVNIKIYNPDGTLFSQNNYNTNSVFIDSIPGIQAGQRYNIIATDQCGNADSVSIGSSGSYFTHEPIVVPKCPSATWSNGSGDIRTTVQTNMGSITVKIIKKNGVNYFPSLSPNTVSGGVYSFIDLGPGTYIISSSENYCNKKVYDTVVINNYVYPNLDRSSAYQCDVNGFSLSAIATNGVAPFSYEIIGSQPTTPSIVTAPQSSPIFNINNGSNYSLIRLRALDACGNATLGDASILPLAINGIISSTDCLSQPTTLTVDSIFNSTYTWYKKSGINSTDSVLVGNGTSYYIPSVSPTDTGIYICYVSVNSGCINRTFSFHLGGECWIILPVKLEEFKGQAMNDRNLLTWATSMEENLLQFTIERKNPEGNFIAIGRVNAAGNSNSRKQYRFVDLDPAKAANEYRLRMEKTDRSFSFSNVVLLDNNGKSISFNVYPNPVVDKITIDFGTLKAHHYTISLLNSLGQLVEEKTFVTDGKSKFELARPATLSKGIYILRVTDQESKGTVQQKLVFR